MSKSVLISRKANTHRHLILTSVLIYVPLQLKYINLDQYYRPRIQ